MYKKNSENLQSRTVRAALFDTKAAGIDPSAWKDMEQRDLELQREALVANKLRLQHQVAEVNAKIAKAGMVARESNRYLPGHVFEKMRADKLRIMGMLTEIDQLTVQLKALAKGKRKSPQEEYYKTFFECAKDMLAGPVFERVRIAAHHRVGAESDNG